MVRWFLLNAKNRLLFAKRNPAYALRSLARDLIFADERFLAAVTGRKVSEIRRFLHEPFGASQFLDHLRACEDVFRQLALVSADLYAKKVLIQYAILRALEPEMVIETGVANGVSTAYLLLALHQNGRGTLHSIEIGDPAFLPPGREPGWVVPEWLRSRWRFHSGDARQVVPALLKQLGGADVFIHDSLHTREHMLSEFEQAYPFLKRGGLLLADDASWNSAFPDFARTVQAPLASIVRGVGVLKK